MTDDTVPHQNGVADDLAAIAAPPPAPAPSPEPELPPEAAAASPEAAPAAPETPETPAEPPPPSFDDLGLHPDVKLALDEMGDLLPTPVQTAVYRPVSEGKDLLVQSRTGTGKTTAFGLPTISKIIPTH
ncbi:MAG TPA: DEAD/DEAH box helicase, partial [Kofleriaceae bacterium]